MSTPFAPFADVLLDRSSSAAQLAAACRSVYDLLREASPVTRAATEWEGDHALAEGLAISPRLAAQCLLDARRTAAFLRGTMAAIESFTRPVDVVYAGTGPFAPLALLPMQRLDPRQVRFTLIDIDRRSTDSVRALLDHFGVSADVICADATTYRHPRAIDLVISETMQCALRREPFVAIARNLVPQLASDGRIVPEQVSVALTLVDQERSPVARLATLSVEAETIVEIAAVPDHWLALFTELCVFGDHVLRAGDSGLTEPEILWQLSPVSRDIRVAFRYETGRDPGFRWSGRTGIS